MNGTDMLVPMAPRATATQCVQHLAAYAYMLAAEAVVQANTARSRHAFIDRAVLRQAAALPSADLRANGLDFLREHAHEALQAILDAGRSPRQRAAIRRRTTGAS